MDKRLIVALDYDSMSEVKQLVSKIGDAVNYYKVGMQLFYSAGIESVEYLREQSKEIFLDLKMHDIPNTVVKSLKRQSFFKVSMCNVHAFGGRELLTSVAQTLKRQAEILNIPRPKLVAVTVLTSMSREDWAYLRQGITIEEQVINLAKLSQECGLDGVVASPQEAKIIREACGKDFLIVTPGVRPQGSSINDHSRASTPKLALANGANYLVVGRPITESPSPRQAALNILKEMEEVK